MTDGYLQPVPKVDNRPANERLDSWKEIAAYLKRDIRTVQRWEKNEGLPVCRHHHDKQGTVFAYKPEVDTWWHGRQAKIEEEESVSASGPQSVPGGAGEVGPDPKTSQGTHKRLRRLLITSLLAILAAAGTTSFLYRTKIWPPKGKSILAVEPFKNLSGDPEAQHIAEGLTEEMVSGLGRLHPEKLGIIELSGAAGMGETSKISKPDYLLEGSVRQAGRRVAITAQLILLKDQTRIWGDSYERDLQDPQDIIPLQIEIANDISNKVLRELPRNDHGPRQVNPDAYESYLKGRFFWNKRTPENLTKAIAYFQRAIEFDPMYAPSYAGLADCYSLMGSAPYTALPPKEAFPKAEAAARKALDLDEGLAEAHVSLGYADLVYERDFPRAEEEFRHAIALRPAYPTAHQYYAYYLTAMGRLEEAIQERKTAAEMDPLSPLFASALGEAYYQARQYDRTIEQNGKSLELDPSYAIALITMGRAYEQKGNLQQARSVYEQILAVAPDDPGILALAAHEYAISGKTTKAREILDSLEETAKRRYVPSLYVALIYTGLGDKDLAFQWLDKAYEERCEYLVYLPSEPLADPLRSDPRFPRLIHRLGLNTR